MRRREFIIGGGAALTLPAVVRAQQPPMPVIGLLNGVSFEAVADRIEAFRQGLKQSGFIEGQNVSISYRSAEGHSERLPSLAADLVRQQVAVIVAIGTAAPAQVAKAATATIPIVFAMGGDALELGLVASLSRPEANVTGVSFFSNLLLAKRLELLRELIPDARLIAFLVNSKLSLSVPSDVRNLEEAAHTLGLQLVVVDAGTEREIDASFATIALRRVAALVLHPDAFLTSRRDQIVALAARQKIPAIYPNREYVQAGGLIGYGSDVKEMYRQAGIYTGRILNGGKPADLPVMQPTKFELFVNLIAAKALDLRIPEPFLIRADEVIE